MQFKRLFLRNVLLESNRADSGDDVLHLLYFAKERIVFAFVVEQRSYHNRLTFSALLNVLPKFFRDKRHERMQESEEPVEEA